MLADPLVAGQVLVLLVKVKVLIIHKLDYELGVKLVPGTSAVWVNISKVE